VGGRLVKDPRVKSVSFTGGLAGGQAIASACAPDFKPVQLELGGNNPVVVFDDADLDLAAQAVVALLTSLNGQWCRALGRLIVHHTRERELIDAVLAKTRALNISSSLDPASQMGPLIHSQHKKKILDQKRAYLDAGASEASDARLPDLGGHFVAPALVRGVSPASAQHEIFGPIGTVHPFRDEAEALSLANGTPYGLEGYVFTRDEARGLAFGRKIRAGGVKVNGSTMLSLNIMAPRPSWGLSGFGVEGTIETLRFFCGTRVVGVEGPMAFGN
jgi:phenylacetaldehyde dehydrogenase